LEEKSSGRENMKKTSKNGLIAWIVAMLKALMPFLVKNTSCSYVKDIDAIPV
jgi:hypothetical protein